MPTKTLAQIQQEIVRLQREAERVRKTEIADVVQRIQAAIEHYGLTTEDLFGSRARRRGRPPKAVGSKRRGAAAGKRRSAKARRVIPVKYRDSHGNTWTGRGSRPRWLVAALNEGGKIDDFAVASKSGS